jgi:nitrogen fixation/metabolism regulation signal transduction histidine kinase
MRATQRIILYLVVLHSLLMIGGIFMLWADYRVWILALEGVLALSLAFGIVFINRQQHALNILSIGGDFMREGDFAHTIQEHGSAEVQKLIRMYNAMLEALRGERLRLEEKQFFLEKILNASPSGILTLDLEGRIARVNPAAAACFSQDPNDLLGKSLHDIHGTLAETLLDLKEGKSRVVTLAGPQRIRCSQAYFFDTGFRRQFFLLENLTAELWANEKGSYEQVIRTFSHEVNNTVGASNSIMRSILTYVDQLNPEDRAEVVGALETVINRNDRLNKFMQRYAEVVRLPKPERHPIQLPDLVERMRMLIQVECNSREIELSLDLANNLPEVHADAAQLEQALLNILRNAMEAVESQGTIQIKAFMAKDVPCIVVEDDGSGISEEIRDNLFFSILSTKQNGHGVGLVLVREILLNHGYEFSLSSPEGQPTQFVIRLNPPESV